MINWQIIQSGEYYKAVTGTIISEGNTGEEKTWKIKRIPIQCLFRTRYYSKEMKRQLLIANEMKILVMKKSAENTGSCLLNGRFRRRRKWAVSQKYVRGDC